MGREAWTVSRFTRGGGGGYGKKRGGDFEGTGGGGYTMNLAITLNVILI